MERWQGKNETAALEILTAMQDLNTPAGALQLAQILHLPSASIGRELLDLEKAGLLVKVQNKGRILTPQGERFLEEERSRREKMKAANELIEAASMETESGLEDILWCGNSWKDMRRRHVQSGLSRRNFRN
ncbi:MAG: hypothetical protein ACLR8P_21690 [Clostridium fessum]